MAKLLTILMVVGVWTGCGGDSPTGDGKEKLLVWTTEYDDGSVKEEYQYYLNPENNEIVKDGWYKSYYRNEKPWEVGTYSEDKRSGEWSFYTDVGEETKGIYENGERLSGEFWLHVKADATLGWVATDEALRETEGDQPDVYLGRFTYADGTWNGLGIIYWQNGRKRAEGLYKDGRQDGYYKRYYERGGIAWKGNYVKGVLDGERVAYYENEDIWAVDNFKNGKLHGRSVIYHENGTIGIEEHYAEGKLDGKRTEYHVDGDVFDEDIYENGVCVEMCEGDESE